MKMIACRWCVVFAVAAAACSQSQQPAQPAQPVATTPPPAPAVDAAPVEEAPAEPADTAVVVTAVENKPTAATNNCSVVVVRAIRGAEELASKSFQDECEEAPSYECKESGEGCSTVDYSVIGSVDLAGQTFWWIENQSEWHDNGSIDVGLYGFQCGRIASVWGYSPDHIGQAISASVALVEEGDWTRIVATVDRDGTKETTKLRWDEEKCRFVKAT